MRAYRSHDSPSEDAAGRIGKALANALRKFSSNAQGGYSDMHSDYSIEMDSLFSMVNRSMIQIILYTDPMYY